jgi:TolA-binding protein
MKHERKCVGSKKTLAIEVGLSPSLFIPFICGSIAFFVFACVSPNRVWADQANPSSVVEDNGKALYEKAQKLFQEKNYKGAKDTLDQLMAKNPVGDYVPKAKLLWANLQQDFDDSIGQFKALAAEYSKTPEGEEAQKDLGARYYLSDKYDDAVQSYKDFLDRYPQSSSLSEVHYWYASSLLALDRNSEAVDEFQKVVHDAPDSSWAPKSLLGIGNAYFKMKNYGDAEKFYLKILDQYHLYEELNLVYFKLGQTYDSEQKWKEAHAAYQTLIQQYPKAFEVDEARGRLQDLEKQHPDLPHAVEAQAPEPSPTTVPQAANPAPTPVPATEPSSLKLIGSFPEPFHVQVGVYSKMFNVNKTRKAIKKAGYSSCVIEIKQEGVPYTIYKVRVGNFSDRATAEKVAKEITRKTKEKTIVIED